MCVCVCVCVCGCVSMGFNHDSTIPPLHWTPTQHIFFGNVTMFLNSTVFYQSFFQLRGQTTHALPLELPAKKWFNNRDQQFVKERKEALQAYLNAVLHLVKPSDCEALESFFSTTTTDTSTKELSENQRFLTLEQATKEFGLIPPQKNNLAVVK